MKNQLLLLCLVYGLSGGPVHLNPTEPFNLYLEVGFVAGLFVASPFVFHLNSAELQICQVLTFTS